MTWQTLAALATLSPPSIGIRIWSHKFQDIWCSYFDTKLSMRNGTRKKKETEKINGIYEFMLSRTGFSLFLFCCLILPALTVILILFGHFMSVHLLWLLLCDKHEEGWRKMMKTAKKPSKKISEKVIKEWRKLQHIISGSFHISFLCSDVSSQNTAENVRRAEKGLNRRNEQSWKKKN